MQTQRLTRAEAAEALTAAGYRTSKLTLSTVATRGGGPRYIIFHRRALYDLEDLLAWAKSREIEVAA